MMYDIEFIRRIDGTAEELALGLIRIVGDGFAGVIARAEQLYRTSDTVPRPDGFRVRDGDGAIIHQFNEEKRA